MTEETRYRGLPPGPNVGTQLAARRRAKAREQRLAQMDSNKLGQATATSNAGLPPKAEVPADAEPASSVVTSRTGVKGKPRGRAHQNADALFAQAPLSPQEWFTQQGWQPFDFQKEVWVHMQQGRSGLLHATTGAGKTLAVWIGALLRRQALRSPCSTNTARNTSTTASVEEHRPAPAAEAAGASSAFRLGAEGRSSPTDGAATHSGAGPQILWITPMRALAADTHRALVAACAAIAPELEIGLRTGDTAASEKTRQRQSWPGALVTTPESLSLMLSLPNASAVLRSVQTVIVDEWHELLGNKRGTQTLLALAHWRARRPDGVVWGLSATLGNVEQACQALTGSGGPIVRGLQPKTLVIDTLLPATMERFPWAGHLGQRMRDAVIQELEPCKSALVFTNTRSQSELWYQQLLDARPEWAGLIALHHGSLDPEVRQWVESGLKSGQLKAVVCTSSLDLGVDFLPVERVLQIGSPKGVARLLQRAGRSGHAPGRPSRITLVPTHALEILEGAAARAAVQAGHIETREAPEWPIDVLAQHMVTLAVGEGFDADALFAEVQSCWPYRALDRETFDACLRFVSQGGEALAAYPDYQRVQLSEEGRWRVLRRDLARRHRMSIGTIVSDTAMQVKWLNGGRLGSLEEGFVAMLRPGDCFIFAGQVLQLVRVRDLTAYVQKAPRGQGAVPTWQGGKMPLSNELSEALLSLLDQTEASDDGRISLQQATEQPSLRVDAQSQSKSAHLKQERETHIPELSALKPLLALQSELSALPGRTRIVFEQFETEEGHHLCLYPLAGRTVHIGLGALLAWRAARDKPGTFSVSMNDWGLELLSRKAFDWARLIEPVGPGSVESGILSEHHLVQDISAALNASELAQRRFREIARVAGLVFQGFPGATRSARQVQASSGLFFDVFQRFEPDHLLLAQAQAETLSQELDFERLARTLKRMRSGERRIVRPTRLTPLAFPLMVERLRERVSTESLNARLERLVAEMEAATDPKPQLASLVTGKGSQRRRKSLKFN